MTIQQIQNLLQYLGYYTIRVDGISGPGTEQAVKDFQDAEGLEADGIPGKLTQAADLVKQMTSIEDFSGATDTALEIRFNELLAALRVASILSK